MGRFKYMGWCWESALLRALKHTIWLVLTLPLICLGNPLPYAKQVTYSFSGELYSAWDPEMTLLGSYSGSITIDPNTPPIPHEGYPDSCCWMEYLSPTIITFVFGDRTWYRNVESGVCSFGVWRSNAGTKDTFDLTCSAENSEYGEMSAWWRFENYPTDTFRGWEIPLGPFAPDEFQDGWIAAHFFGYSPDSVFYEVRGSLRLTGVNVTSEPHGIAILVIGLIGILFLRRREERVFAPARPRMPSTDKINSV